MSSYIQEIEEELIDQYVNDDNPRPWIIGFSGGKDSTMLLQVVWNAVKSIPAEARNRKIYVVCNNTLVENPKILEYSEKVLSLIQKAAAEQSMPVYVNQTTPKLEDSFWVNLIGKGYPAPNNQFRWCTNRLKIDPTTQFILNKIDEEGEAIILLGTRSDESATRAKSIKKHAVKGQRLSKHVLPKAFVYAPIKHVLIDDLWQYLMQVPSPWGANNKELVTLYRNANSGDCPLVIDTTTPSCGNSRFGCWVCTVVKKDKSMTGLVGNGEDWMEPLMEFRDMLMETRNLEGWRETKRRNQVDGPGPYNAYARSQFLEKLLRAQFEIQQTHPDMTLINYQEIVAIQVLWYRDGMFSNKASDIYNKIYGTNLSFENISDKEFKEKELLKESCSNRADYNLINELLTLQKSKTILMNSRGLQNDFENRIEQFLQSGK
jgi:DNA sulfur modification protein DndC